LTALWESGSPIYHFQESDQHALRGRDNAFSLVYPPDLSLFCPFVMEFAADRWYGVTMPALIAGAVIKYSIPVCLAIILVEKSRYVGVTRRTLAQPGFVPVPTHGVVCTPSNCTSVSTCAVLVPDVKSRLSNLFLNMVEAKLWVSTPKSQIRSLKPNGSLFFLQP
jgi:hypothetical protein